MKKIDVHGHFGHWNFPIPNLGRVENLLRLCEKHEIEHVACSSVLALCYSMEEGNAELAQAFAGYPQLWGYVYVNANFLARSVAEMERYLSLSNFRGVKIHTSYSGVNNADPRMEELIAEVARRTNVVKIHCGGPNVPETLAQWSARYPQLNIIVAHALGTGYIAAARIARRFRNVYLEFSSSWAGADKIAHAVEICGVRQILFGTDMDLLDPAFMIGQYENAELSEEQLRTIYWDNPLRVFGISEA